MHNIQVDSVNKTADFVIEDDKEREIIIRGLSVLIGKQERKTTKKSSNDVISQVEIDKLERFMKLPEVIKVGPVRLNVQQMFDLENALNEGIVNYEKEVTDDPADETLTEAKSFKQLVHNILTYCIVQ